MLFRFVKLSLVFVLLSPAVASTSRIWNLPRQEINFIGREKQLMDLEDSLPKNHLVAIVGLAGIGKTSLAKEFALKHRESYQVVWFIDLKKDLDGQLHQLALELSRKKIISFEVSPYNVSEGVNTALSWLRSTEAGWLLIFDNVEKNVDISTSFPDLNNHPHKHVIVTTRYNPGWCKKLLLKSFSGKEAFEFLQHLLGDEYPMEELLKLASVLGNHPRALLQASSYINRAPGMTCRLYVDMFERSSKKLSEEEKMILTKQEASIELYSSLELLLENIRRDSPESLMFLATLSFMSCSHIEEEFLIKAQSLLKHEGQLTYKHLVEPSLLVKENKGYSIHPYVATVVQNYVSDEQKIEALVNGMEVLVSYLDNNTDKIVKLFEDNPNLLNHVLDITRHYNGDSKLATELEVAALFYLFYFQRRYEIANPLAERCKERIERSNNKLPSLAEGRFYSLYSFMVYDNSTLPEAITACLKASEILEKIDDEAAKDELVLLLCNNLTFYYGAQGDTSKMLESIERASILIGDQGADKNKMFLLFNRLLCTLDTGDYEQARAYLKEALNKIKGSELEKSALHILYLYAAKIEMKESNMNLAKEHAERAYQLALGCAGDDEKHETVARVGVILSLCELHDGNLIKAERLADNAVEGFTKSYGSDSKNRMQAYAHMVKGDVLVAGHNLEGALESYIKALKIYQIEFTNMKVDDVSELYSKFISLGLLMKNELLAKDYLAQHIEIFGMKHPRSIAALKKFEKAA